VPHVGIVKGLQSVRSSDLPVAVIRDASSSEQKVWVATLGTIVNTTKGETLSPSIIVAGQVVQLMHSPQRVDGRSVKSLKEVVGGWTQD
jgi:uroporphyrinogen III methyltransferase / synthase